MSPGRTYLCGPRQTNIYVMPPVMPTNSSSSWFGFRFYGVKRQFQQYFSYIVEVSFIGGGNQSIRRKQPTCRNSQTINIDNYNKGDT